MNLENVLTLTERLRLVTALRGVQAKVRWKPGREMSTWKDEASSFWRALGRY